MEKLNCLTSICLLHQCSICCNPVKIDFRRSINNDLFIDLEEILVPENHIDTIRLKSYQCINFNQNTGLCDDYHNRPVICKNTKCSAFNEDSRENQAEIIKIIKSKKFLRIPAKNIFS